MEGELIRRNPDERKKNYSIIHWQTGEPEEGYCFCLVTTKSGIVREGVWIKERGWSTGSLFHSLDVIAWCLLSDIEPYKDKE